MNIRQATRQTAKDLGVKLRNSYLLFLGDSLLSGAPIFAVITGFVRPSGNDKTGDILQVWFIGAEQHPQDAINSGCDSSICGDCPFRKCSNNGHRLCYVEMKTVFNIYHAFCRGSYTFLPSLSLLDGWQVRIGAYGDPASVPASVLAPIVDRCSMVTSYTHLWKNRADLASFSMASVVTPLEYLQAKALGFNTFRVRSSGDCLQYEKEVVCPATTHGLTCSECGLCSAKGVDVVIPVHGADWIVGRFNEKYRCYAAC